MFKDDFRIIKSAPLLHNQLTRGYLFLNETLTASYHPVAQLCWQKRSAGDRHCSSCGSAYKCEPFATTAAPRLSRGRYQLCATSVTHAQATEAHRRMRHSALPCFCPPTQNSRQYLSLGYNNGWSVLWSIQLWNSRPEIPSINELYIFKKKCEKHLSSAKKKRLHLLSGFSVCFCLSMAVNLHLHLCCKPYGAVTFAHHNQRPPPAKRQSQLTHKAWWQIILTSEQLCLKEN